MKINLNFFFNNNIHSFNFNIQEEWEMGTTEKVRNKYIYKQFE